MMICRVKVFVDKKKVGGGGIERKKFPGRDTVTVTRAAYTSVVYYRPLTVNYPVD